MGPLPGAFLEVQNANRPTRRPSARPRHCQSSLCGVAGTPHGVDLRHAVALHHGRHAVLEAGDQHTAVAEALARPGLDVLELRTERDRNVAQHGVVWARAAAAVRDALAAHA